jgi:hypothetical protein
MFSSGNTFENTESFLHALIGSDGNQAGRGSAMVGDQYGLLTALQSRDDVPRISLEGCNRFRAHKAITVSLFKRYEASDVAPQN